MDPRIVRRHLLEFAAPMIFATARAQVVAELRSGQFFDPAELDRLGAERAWAMAEKLADAGERAGHVQPKDPRE